MVLPELKDNELERIFEYFWNTSYITNIVVISSEGPCVTVDSYQPFSADFCRKVKVERLYELCEESPLKLHVFPRVLKNLHKCEVTCNSWIFEKTLYEVNSMALFSSRINSTLLVTENSDPDSDLTTIDRENFDIIYGAWLLRLSRTKIMSASFPITFNRMYFFLRNEQTLKTSVEILLEPFHWSMWLALLASCVVGTILLYLIKRSSILGETSIMICAVLGISTNFHSSHFAIRVQYFCWMCLGVMLTASHHAISFEILKFELLKKLPDTVKEVVASNFTDTIIVPNPIGDEIFKHLPKLAGMKIELIGDVEIVGEVMHRDKMVLGLLTDLMVFHSGEGIDSFHYLKDAFATLLHTIYFTKNSFLLESFNKMVLDLFSGGIMQKWKTDFYGNSLHNSKHNDYVKALGFRELKGVFEVWAVFLGCSFVIFIGEIVYVRFKGKFKKLIKDFFSVIKN